MKKYTIIAAKNLQEIEEQINAFAADKNAKLASFAATNIAWHLSGANHPEPWFYAVMEEESEVAE